MPDIQTALAANRAAVAAFHSAIDRLGPKWTSARAPGKWTGAQLAEHVANSYDVSCAVVRGRPSGLPSFPGFLQWLPRIFFVNKVLKSGSFGQPVKTQKPFEPIKPSSSPAEARVRLDRAVATFEAAVAERQAGEVLHPVFGRLTMTDYIRFQELHTRHHMGQLPQA